MRGLDAREETRFAHGARLLLRRQLVELAARERHALRVLVLSENANASADGLRSRLRKTREKRVIDTMKQIAQSI